MKVQDYDILVVGSGSGAAIVDAALNQGLTVGWVDKGPLGGTCLNVGCIPTKMLIAPADRVVEVQEAGKLGVEATVGAVDFDAIVGRTRAEVSSTVAGIREGIRQAGKRLDLYEREGHFIDKYTLQVGEERIRGKKVFLAAGARPFLPPILGLEQVNYLTNENVLQLERRPESLAIVGGSYIGVEFAHFFAAMGTRVLLLGRNVRLLPEEEPEVSEVLRKKLAERMEVRTGIEVTEVRPNPGGHLVLARDRETGQTQEFLAERIMIAAGRQSNADLLQAEKGGLEVNSKGFVQVDDYLETRVRNVWAFGDIIGKFMFTHVANREAVVAWHNATHEHKVPMDWHAIPHAVFTHPQIASVGMTEAQARQDHDVLIGWANYMDVAKGQAIMEMDGFAKAIVDRETGNLLGFHIVGPDAPVLIQEVIDAMANDVPASWLGKGLHIHPAMPELILATLQNLHAH